MKSVEADIEFHEIIISSSGYPRAINIWTAIKNQVKTLIFAVNRKESNELLPLNNQDHNEIINAFKQEDYIKLSSLLTEHIEGGMELCLSPEYKKENKINLFEETI